MRSTMMAAVLAISTLLAAAPAMASEHGGGKANGANYPVAAQQFEQKIQNREAKARERMEKRVASMNAEQAAEVRAKFDAKIAKLDAEVAKVTADGTVTKGEAKEVRHVAKELGGKHHKHANAAERAPQQR